VLPRSLTAIEKEVFDGCSALKLVEFKGEISKLEASAFPKPVQRFLFNDLILSRSSPMNQIREMILSPRFAYALSVNSDILRKLRTTQFTLVRRYDLKAIFKTILFCLNRQKKSCEQVPLLSQDILHLLLAYSPSSSTKALLSSDFKTTDLALLPLNGFSQLNKVCRLEQDAVALRL
jgi:hypothetical protein